MASRLVRLPVAPRFPEGGRRRVPPCDCCQPNGYRLLRLLSALRLGFVSRWPVLVGLFLSVAFSGYALSRLTFGFSLVGDSAPD